MEESLYPVRRDPCLLRRDAGALQIARRPVDYRDRRTDGYTEPLEIYVLGTSHASEASSRDVQRVIRAVRPQSVVVEVRRDLLHSLFNAVIFCRCLTDPGISRVPD